MRLVMSIEMWVLVHVPNQMLIGCVISDYLAQEELIIISLYSDVWKVKMNINTGYILRQFWCLHSVDKHKNVPADTPSFELAW